MTQVVSHHLLTMEIQVQKQASPCGVCGGLSGTGAGFSPEYFGFHVSVILPMLIFHSSTNIIKP
jgi:hypothetical protein